MKIKLLTAFVMLYTLQNAQTNYTLNFNGISDYVNLGSSAGSNLRSIEFWFKPASNITSSISSPDYVFVGRNDATQLHEYGLFIAGSSQVSSFRGHMLFYISNNGTYYYATSDNTSWTADTWYHVCGTIDQVSGMKLYINGTLQATTDTYTSAIPVAGEITTLGRWGDLAIRYFPGRMDEVRFWNRTLSQNEIQQKMCYWLNPANENGLTGYWKMDEGSGSVISDATVSSNNGTISGATFVQDPNCFTGFLGKKEEINQISVSVSPNPFSSETSLKVDDALMNATLTIYNSLGQQVKQIDKISSKVITLKRDDWPCGLYFICIMQDNKLVITKKMVITDN